MEANPSTVISNGSRTRVRRGWVLTDGGVCGAWRRGVEALLLRRHHGISLARRAGFELGLISGEDSTLVSRYAEKMHIRHVIKGCRDKATALREIAASTGIELAEICYMGDDVNDLPAMQIAGFSAAPANAASDVLAQAKFISGKAGGNGAVRELIEALLAARGLHAQEFFAPMTHTHTNGGYPHEAF